MASVENEPVHESPIDRATGELKPLQNSFDDRVQTALEGIAPKARSCLLLRTVEGLSYKEISKLMDIPEGTAMNLVHRSKKKLRELLSQENQAETANETANETLPSKEGGGHER